MNDNSDPVWDLVDAGKYSEAYDLHTALGCDKGLAEWQYLLRRSELLALNEQYDDAVTAAARADEIVLALNLGVRLLWKVGLYKWLDGDAKEGIRALAEQVRGIISKEITYTDAIGGGNVALLLWALARIEGDIELAGSAVKFMRRLTISSHEAVWPRPICRFVLDELDQRHLMSFATGKDKIKEAAARAKKNEIAKLQYCQSIFYCAIKSASDAEMSTANDLFEEVVRFGYLSNSEWLISREILTNSPRFRVVGIEKMSAK